MFGIQNLRSFLQDPIPFLNDLGTEPKVVRMKMAGKPFVFVFDATIARKLLLNRDGSVAQNRAIFDRIQPVTGKKGMVQLEGKASRKSRGKVMPFFGPSSLEQMRPQIQSIAEEEFAKLAQKIQLAELKNLNGHSLAISHFCNEMILKTALRIFVGKTDDQTTEAIASYFLQLNQLCGESMRSFLPIPQWMPTKRNRAIQFNSKMLRLELSKAIESLTEKGLVLKVFEKDPTLIDQVSTFLFAGHETTASSIAFTLFEAARNPFLQKKLADGTREERLSIYKESLRLHPPAYMLARQINKSVELGGFQFEKGDQVIIGLRQMHRMEDYFVDAESFQWDRFLDSSKSYPAFMPFGLGAKSCVGEQMALLEADVILERFCKKFLIAEKSENFSIKENAFITLHPRPTQTLKLNLHHVKGGQHVSRAKVV